MLARWWAAECGESSPKDSQYASHKLQAYGEQAGKLPISLTTASLLCSNTGCMPLESKCTNARPSYICKSVTKSEVVPGSVILAGALKTQVKQRCK